MNTEDLSEQLAACGAHLSAAEWRDFLASDEATQARIVDTMTLAATPPGPDYWAAVLAVLKVGGTIIGAASGVGSAVSIVQGLAKL